MDASDASDASVVNLCNSSDSDLCSEKSDHVTRTSAPTTPATVPGHSRRSRKHSAKRNDWNAPDVLYRARSSIVYVLRNSRGDGQRLVAGHGARLPSSHRCFLEPELLVFCTVSVAVWKEPLCIVDDGTRLDCVATDNKFSLTTRDYSLTISPMSLWAMVSEQLFLSSIVVVNLKEHSRFLPRRRD